MQVSQASGVVLLSICNQRGVLYSYSATSNWSYLDNDNHRAQMVMEFQAGKWVMQKSDYHIFVQIVSG